MHHSGGKINYQLHKEAMVPTHPPHSLPPLISLTGPADKRRAGSDHGGV